MKRSFCTCINLVICAVSTVKLQQVYASCCKEASWLHCIWGITSKVMIQGFNAPQRKLWTELTWPTWVAMNLDSKCNTLSNLNTPINLQELSIIIFQCKSSKDKTLPERVENFHTGDYIYKNICMIVGWINCTFTWILSESNFLA